ncbi:hypothetical protein SAMD00019534_031550 [Acytostelium subglobosum LB1]|uniref:hypothetical protein n=1 Tax=Acytostelium subglobosum LB1 TaxID=1410327 RepID=UPI000645212C|nr:hypothetical protein SAMD00019534_031550 [Acytostelium subglobosum LB1]GAM19980.1 hypothetical protein SAMD00019534_031550 [Acytostelium subglobosum LB1]|eukprot:XP_012756742.1 hypothetical protein SAMD00019534_031550 [Acytostelium subglobosum LB1]
MFFSQIVLSKRGPLGKVWLAGHWDRKLTKSHVFKTNIPKSIRHILHPHLPMALRMTSHLLLGVVRIFSKKVKFLLDDCGDAVARFKGTTKMIAPGINLAVAEEEEDPQTLTTTSKQGNVAHQIDDYLRSVILKDGRIEDLVVDKFFESKKFQQLYMEAMKPVPAPSAPSTPGQRHIDEPGLSPEQQDTSVMQEDLEKQQRIDIEIMRELDRMDAERKARQEELLPQLKERENDDSFISYKQWIENFHEDEMVMRGAQSVSIHITPQRQSIEPSAQKTGPPGTGEEGDDQFRPYSPSSPYQAPPVPADVSIGQHMSPGLEIEPTSMELQGVFDPVDYYPGTKFDIDKDDPLQKTGKEMDLPIPFIGSRPDDEEWMEQGGDLPPSPPQQGGDYPPSPPPPDVNQERPDTAVDSQKPRGIIPLIEISPPEQVQPKTTKAMREAQTRRIGRRALNRTDINRLRNNANSLLTQHRTFPTTSAEFHLQTKTLSAPGPKYSMLMPVRRVINERITDQFRDIFHRYKEVLDDDDVKLMSYLKAAKVHQSLKEFEGMGVDFDSTMKESLGIPPDMEFDKLPLKEQVILSKVTEHIEDKLNIAPNKRAKIDSTITEEEEAQLLGQLEKELDMLAMHPVSPARRDDLEHPYVGDDKENVFEVDLGGGGDRWDDYQHNPVLPEDDLSPIKGDLSPIKGDDDGIPFKTPQQTPKKTPGPGSWTPRTSTMHTVLNNYFNTHNTNSINFESLVADKQTRVAVAGTFYEMLVLKTKGLVEVHQDEAYSDIQITKTSSFNQTKSWAREPNQQENME